MLRLGVSLCLLLLACQASAALVFSNRYSSPRNPERAHRASTNFIILHTTEAEASSSLKKLSQNGEIHYCVDRDGKVYRIVNRNRVAYHCGTSMWNGKKNIDNDSIGIEAVGYHDKPLTMAQYAALRELIHLLQKSYNIKDVNVMSHSQVAYGTPNRWHPKSHRGRKRCGMSYATPGVRKLLGLRERWLVDPDVQARRLVIGDALLARILYDKNGEASLPFKVPTLKSLSKTAVDVVRHKAVPTPVKQEENVITKTRSAWDIARAAYNQASTVYVFPNGKRVPGDQIKDWSAIVEGTRVIRTICDNESPIQVLNVGSTPRALAGDAAQAEDTWYIRPTGGVVNGKQLTAKQLVALPKGTQVLVGYRRAGPVRSDYFPAQICPSQWDAPDTCYLIPGKPLQPFQKIDMRYVPPGTYLFYRN